MLFRYSNSSCPVTRVGVPGNDLKEVSLVDADVSASVDVSLLVSVSVDRIVHSRAPWLGALTRFFRM